MASRTRFIDNPGVSAFGTSNFPTSASHAGRADIADSVRQENLIFSGSFSGSFEGNGEGLTDIPAASIVGLNLSQISSGSYSASIAPAGTFKTNADATIDGDLTVTKDFKVFGSASFTHASNLTVSDKYILLASGSAGATDGGIVVEQAANGKGALLAYDAAASRWGLTSSFDANTSAGYTPDAYIVNTLNGLSTTSDIPSIYNKEGNIFIDSLNDSWIYSNKWNKIIVSEGNQQLTGSLIISGSTSPLISLPSVPTDAIIISGSNDRTRLHIYESVLNSSPIYTEGAGIKLVGGTAVGNQATLELSAVGSSNAGSNNEQTFIHSNQQLVIQAADDDAGKNIKFRGSSYGLDLTAATAGVTLAFLTNGGGTVSELNMGNGTYIQADANGTYYKIGRSSTDWLNLSSTKATFAADVSSSITSTASFGTYLGDGSQLTGIVTATNLTQSLFVTPSGDNATATVGDLMKPFSTILGATGSANPGDTIIVYPGTYVENHNLYKDGVNYHFINGAKVVATSPVEPMWGGGSGAANSVGTSFSSSVSITGYGEFISTTSNTQKSAIFYIQAPSGVIEIKRAVKHGIGGAAYNLVAGFGQVTSIDSTGVLTVRGKFENSGSATSYCNVVSFGQGNINTDIVVRSENGTGIGVYLWSDTGDLNGTMDVYSEATALFTQADTRHLTHLKGRFETLTTNQGSYYALNLNAGYRGSFQVDAEIRGAIYINPGDSYESSVKVSGYQEISNSPDGGANVILSGHNQLSQKIYGVESAIAAFKVTGGVSTYDGFVRLTGTYPKIFDVSGGIFHWKGTSLGSPLSIYPTTRTNPSEVSGGELIIESQLDCFDANDYLAADDYVFNLSGGTLDIQSKIRQYEFAGNNGIVNMTGGYLKMNGAELVHATKTGSFAYAIDLNNQTHSGSILNNCFTNLQPFNSGSFTNEVTGGGTLFESHKLY